MKSSFKIDHLGESRIPSPLRAGHFRFVSDQKKIAIDPFLSCEESSGPGVCDGFEVAGPREKVFFSPGSVRAFIVSCGGLCPGINGVIRSLVMQLWFRYGCQNIFGIRFGYQGMCLKNGASPEPLRPEALENIHETGGSFLGSSRGCPPPEEVAEFICHHRADILFTIGGDGTQRGALEIANECRKKSWPISVVGIPKTIDNDIAYVKRSFGFDTAVSVACQAILSASHEARGYQNGVGLVRLMGRHSGYIAASAALAAGHVSFCLIPEVPFYLEGDSGLLVLLQKCLAKGKHPVVVVAEGAGQYYFPSAQRVRDASGNIRLGNIGIWLQDQITMYFEKKAMPVSVKYIDPGYMIRSAPANPADQLFCAKLARNAVHAAMAGKTGMVIGYWHGTMTHVPFHALGDYRQSVCPRGNLWSDVLETTGQPGRIGEA